MNRKTIISEAILSNALMNKHFPGLREAHKDENKGTQGVLWVVLND